MTPLQIAGLEFCAIWIVAALVVTWWEDRKRRNRRIKPADRYWIRQFKERKP